MVAGRSGGRKLWDLTERFLPEWTPREPLSWPELVHRASQKSLRGLGVAPAEHIRRYFIRGCYPGLPDILAQLEAEEKVARVQIVNSEGQSVWRGEWYVHADDLSLLDELSSGGWEPRTTLLSPFDNLISDRKRTERVFNFKYRFEVYVPKAKREYGAYVMPILHGDRFIGRIDPKMDRGQGRLLINAVYADPDAPMTAETGQAVAAAVEELGAFLGAEDIVFGQRVPEGWKSTLQ